MLTLGFLLSLTAWSQAEISEGDLAMSQGTNNGLSFSIPTSDEKIAKDVWEKYVKSIKGKTKYNRNTNEILTDDAKIKELSANTVDIYAKLTGDKMTVWVDLGGAYLNSEDHTDQYAVIEGMIDDYHDAISLHLAEVNLKKQEDALKSLTGDLKRLENENGRYNKAIEKAQQEIAENERLIKVNLSSQDAKKGEISAQQAKVDDAKEEVSSFQVGKKKS